jgi:large subunit ribosomal protein L25
MPIKVETKDLEQLLNRGARRGVIELEVEGDDHVVMVREVQRHPVKRNVLHIDFLKVSMSEKIQTSVPVNVIGEERVVIEGGILQYLMREIAVECLPNAIPDHITVDVSELFIGDNITLGDIESPEGVDIVGDPADIVVTIVTPKEEEEEEEEEELEVDEFGVPLEGEELEEGEVPEGEELEEEEEPRQEI